MGKYGEMGALLSYRSVTVSGTDRDPDRATVTDPESRPMTGGLLFRLLTGSDRKRPSPARVRALTWRLIHRAR